MSKNLPFNRHTQEFFVLASTAELLTSLNLDDVLVRTLSLLTESTAAQRGSFIVFNEDSPTADRYITRQDLPPERSQTMIAEVLEKGLAGWVYHTRTPVLITDTLEDERWVVFPDDLQPMRSALCVPFLVDGHINGIMTLEHTRPGHFSEDDLRLVTAVAHQASIALRNAQLFHQVETHERQIRAVLESTADAILTLSPDGNIWLLNAAAQEMIGRSPDTLIGRPLTEIGANPFFAEVASRIAAGENSFQLRDEAAGRDYRVQVSDWQQSITRELGHVIVFTDVTPFKELDRLKSQMLQIASHDLKNPLGVVLGYAEMMLMEMDPAHPYYEFAADIARVTQRMLEMVTQLLDVERIESTATGMAEDIDPLALIRDLLEEAGPRAAQKRQSLSSDLPDQAPLLRGDPAQLREAFKNLVDNAIKYTPEGGKVLARASTEPESGRFHFSVIDNGYGIPKELQGRIFQRFYRAKQPGAEQISGTGLGLSLVKAVIERHGGAVWFESEPGRGSTFGFWLPLAAPTAES